MNKLSKSKLAVEITSIIELFETQPQTAYSKVVDLNLTFRSFGTNIFWDAFANLDLPALINLLPNSKDVFEQMAKLKLFHDLDLVYQKVKSNWVAEIKSLNPDLKSLIKAFFINLEIGETTSTQNDFPKYSVDSLEAVKILLAEITPLLSPKTQSGYSANLAQLSRDLIGIQVDIILLKKFHDAFLNGGFILQNLENEGFLLTIPENQPQTKNLIIHNELKNKIKRGFIKQRAQVEISKLPHFEKVDPKYKSSMGFSSLIHNSSVKEGVNTLLISDTIFKNLPSTDPVIKTHGITELMLEMMKQAFQVYLRQAFESIFQPNDNIQIKDLVFPLKESSPITGLDIINVSCCLSAIARVFDHYSITSLTNLKSFKQELCNLLLKTFPEWTELQINNDIDVHLATSIEEFENKFDLKTLRFLDQTELLNLVKQMDGLDRKTDAEILAILDHLTNLKSILPFNPIYKLDHEYYFSYATFNKFDINRLIYDYFLSAEIFKNDYQGKAKANGLTPNHDVRSNAFVSSLANSFKIITPFVETNLNYNIFPKTDYKDFLDGDFDLIAYFEKENILFLIQIKLSNITLKNYKGKKNWVKTKILDGAVKQIKKDFEVLSSNTNLEIIGNKLNVPDLNKFVTAEKYPLIITDTFLVDHISYKFNESGDEVKCISNFEIEQLIIGARINEYQSEFPKLSNSHPAADLINRIEGNTFWRFLEGIKTDYKYSKSLSMINRENQIEMRY